MAHTDFKKTIKTVVTQLTGSLNARNKDIVARRFGLKNGTAETLQAIGDDYHITRERVRQIEESSLKQMREQLASDFGSKVQPFVSLAESFIDHEGGIARQEVLFDKFSGSSKPTSLNASLIFLLVLDGRLKRHIEDDDLNTLWSISEAKHDEFLASLTDFIKVLGDHKVPLSESAMAELCNSKNIYFKEPLPKMLISFLTISKHIDRNVFGEIGLTAWPDVKPRGVRDKSFLVLKRAAEPKHFREITELINTCNFTKNKANIQTVHNELIKDKRFVLVGRGIYGLTQWGYEKGTIKDLIVKLLKKSGPLHRTQVIAHVMSARFVKQNTIILGLKDKKLFDHDPKGVVKLKRS